MNNGLALRLYPVRGRHENRLACPLTTVAVTSDDAREAMTLPYGLDDDTIPPSDPPCKRGKALRLSWCPPYNGGGDNDTDDNDGEAGHAPSSTAGSAFPTKTMDTKNMASVQSETTPIIAAIGIRSGREGKDDDSGGFNAAEPKPRSLLAQPHIRTLLVITGLYSVRTFSSFVPAHWV